MHGYLLMDLRERFDGTAERHPWERARFAFFCRVLAEADLLRASQSVLDVGSGDAWFARQLVDEIDPRATVCCWDAEYRADSIRTLRESTPRIHFSSGRPDLRADLVLLLDVLEHVEDDAGFLRELTLHSLAPGAHVLVSVPAYGALYASHDTFLGHHRRYAPSSCASLLERAGLRILRRGGLFHSLLLARLATKARELGLSAIGKGSAAESQAKWTFGPLVTAAVDAALSLDNSASTALSKYGIFVPGLSFWALCRA